MTGGLQFSLLEGCQKSVQGCDALVHKFRAGMAEFIASSTPVAVTRHGQTIGYFIPTHGEVEADIASLKKASKTLDRLLAAKSIDVDGVVAACKGLPYVTPMTGLYWRAP